MAWVGLMRASHTGKAMNNDTETSRGTMNAADFHPYVAPNVRLMMKVAIATSILHLSAGVTLSNSQCAPHEIDPFYFFAKRHVNLVRSRTRGHKECCHAKWEDDKCRDSEKPSPSDVLTLAGNQVDHARYEQSGGVGYGARNAIQSERHL